MLRLILASDFDGPHQLFKGELDQAVLIATHTSLQEALYEYPKEVGKIDYDRVTGDRKLFGRMNQTMNGPVDETGLYFLS